jgi:predicted Zn-dependent peptidase
MTPTLEHADYRRLSNGIELAVLPTARRSVVAMEMRFLAGYAYEHPDFLGVAHVLAEVITKGTESRDGRGLNDAFDQIGASYHVSAGRETLAFSCVCLPEFIAPAIELHAEMIRTPSLPDDACRVAVDLTHQALAALDDDPAELAKKYLHRQAYGKPLDRHVYGEIETLDRITRRQVLDHWQRYLRPAHMQVSIAGAVERDAIAGLFDSLFEASTTDGSDGGDEERRQGPRIEAEAPFPLVFHPGRSHHPKELEQEQIAVCFPGASARDPDEAVERVLVNVLAGGMSSRLLTAVRERQGLVYWAGAWFDRPRIGGTVHLGASTTPHNLQETFATLLREVERLADDVTEQEVQRAIAGITAMTETHGDVTRAKAVRLANDLFYLGRPVPLEERLARIRAVTPADIRDYLRGHRRDRLSIVTLGPQALEGGGTGAPSRVNRRGLASPGVYRRGTSQAAPGSQACDRPDESDVSDH